MKSKLALGGIRVIELSHWAAGPVAGMILGDLGAEVILVERQRGPVAVHAALTYKGRDNLFLSTNRSKKSLGLDLSSEKGREIFYQLIRVSDVFLTNLRPSVLEKLQIGYQKLKEINPKLVVTHLTGYGLTGPYKDRASFDPIAQAMSGGMSITGEPGRPPVRSGLAIADYTGALLAAFGAVCALLMRQASGVGNLVDISLLDGQISILGYIASQYLNFGLVHKAAGSGHPTVPLYRAFKCKDNRYIQIAAHERFDALCAALEIPEMVLDERFDTLPKLIDNRDLLHNIIEPLFLRKTAEEWVNILAKADIPVSKVNTIDEVCNDPQVLARNMIATIRYADGGQIRLPGNPIKIGNGSLEEMENCYTPPPGLGEHTDQIMREILGYRAEDIKELRERLVLF